jgi:UDP-N-acetylmuramoyl-tripeptide--D-alanyl-D-alanine ligase
MRLSIEQIVQALTTYDAPPEISQGEVSKRRIFFDVRRIVDSRNSDGRVERITWDSRAVQPGDAFIALKGERVDGNAYIMDVLEQGARCIIATAPISPDVKDTASKRDATILWCSDGRVALTAIAAYNRSVLSCPVVGITGSTGKTTTKDLVSAVLSSSFQTVATTGNRNNELGVPATILMADETTEALVVEMGMRGIGQIEELCSCVRPTIGVITNIGVTHLELLHTQENIARAKAELIASLPEKTGIAILNADDSFTPFIKQVACIEERNISVLTYGLGPKAQIRASDIIINGSGCASFSLEVPGFNSLPVVLTIPGRHNVMNALAAVAVGYASGIDISTIVLSLQAAQGSAMRHEIIDTARGVRILNDAYNANPDSMNAALELLASLDCSGRRIAVLGDMGELGTDQARLHYEVGQVAARQDVDILITVGVLGHEIACGARTEGMCNDSVIETDDVVEAIALLDNTLDASDLVLVKASRFMEFEHIVEGLVS